MYRHYVLTSNYREEITMTKEQREIHKNSMTKEQQEEHDAMYDFYMNARLVTNAKTGEPVRIDKRTGKEV